MLRLRLMANELQGITKTEITTEVDVTPVPFSQLSAPQQDWVDFTALQGIITEADGTQSKMTVQQFADSKNVSRNTCYVWQRAIPNFWDLVRERQKTMNNGARLAKVWNALYVAAANKLDVRAIQTYLANNDPNFRMPHQRVEHEVGGGLADLLEIARQRNIKSGQGIIEGEIVNEPTDPAAS